MSFRHVAGLVSSCKPRIDGGSWLTGFTSDFEDGASSASDAAPDVVAVDVVSENSDAVAAVYVDSDNSDAAPNANNPLAAMISLHLNPKGLTSMASGPSVAGLIA